MKKKIDPVKDTICGQIPDGFIICGWIIKTNANSKPYDVIGNWERKKELQIIGNNCFKFKIDLENENNLEGDIDIDWTLEIFCIHTDFLVLFNSNISNNNKHNEHYFLNCDCCLGKECYYNGYFKYKNWRKLDDSDLKKMQNKLRESEYFDDEEYYYKKRKKESFPKW